MRYVTSLILAISALCTLHAGNEITMMTYNIQGHDINSTRVGYVSTVINNYSPDIVAIQEINNRKFLIPNTHFEDIAKNTGMKSYFFPLVGTNYGIGLLYKGELISITTQRFKLSDSSKDKEDRGIIIAELDKDIFISTHYSLNADDRDTATN